MNMKFNPKALQLDGLDTMSKKVTIGFKCNPKIKLKLAHEAGRYGLTLSEYVENILLDLDGASKADETLINNLKEKLAFYENDILKHLFKKFNGELIEFKNEKGDDLKIRISKLTDIYTIIINSFKISK